MKTNFREGLSRLAQDATWSNSTSVQHETRVEREIDTDPRMHRRWGQSGLSRSVKRAHMLGVEARKLAHNTLQIQEPSTISKHDDTNRETSCAKSSAPSLTADSDVDRAPKNNEE